MTAPPAPPVVSFPADPLVLRQHDTSGSVAMQILSGLVEDPGAMGASATFGLWDETAGAVVAGFPKSAVISNTGTDPATGTYFANVSYPLSGGDVTGTPGRYLMEFTITFAS